MITDSDEGQTTFQKILTGSGIVFVGLVVEMGLSFLAKILIARILGPIDFGAVSLGITVFTITSYLVLVGLDTGVGRYLPRYDRSQARRGIIVSALQITVPLSILVAALLFVAAPAIARHLFHDPGTAPVLRVFSIVIPFAVIVKISLGSIRGVQKSLPKVYLKNIFIPSTRFAAIAIAIAVGLGGVGVAWAYTASYGLASVLGVYYLVRHTDVVSGGQTERMHSELLAFSAPLMITSGMALIYDKIDTIMLGYYWSTGEVGIYNVLYPIAWALLVFLNAFRYLFMPVISELHSEDRHRKMKRMYQVTTKWIFLATLPAFLVLALFPRQVLVLAFGPEYGSGDVALVVLSAAFFTHAFVGPNYDALTAVGATRRIMYDNVVVAVANVVLNFLLIPRYSFLGAAVATALSYMLLNLLYSYQLYRETGIHPVSWNLVRPGVVALSFAVVAHRVIVAFAGVTVVSVGAMAVGFGIGYPLVVLRFSSLSDEEREMISRLEGKFGRDLDPIKRIARILSG